jgi:hypothetical protein
MGFYIIANTVIIKLYSCQYHYQKGDCENYLFQDYQWKSGIGV